MLAPVISRDALAAAARTKTFVDIARAHGVSVMTISRLARQWGIAPPPDANRRGGRKRQLPTLEILEAELADGKTIAQLAEELGSTPGSLRVTMNRDRRLKARAAKGEAA